MIRVIKKVDVIATDAAIKKAVEKYGLFDERMVLMRSIFNILTNNNGERPRCRKILGRFIETGSVLVKEDKEK